MSGLPLARPRAPFQGLLAPSPLVAGADLAFPRASQDGTVHRKLKNRHMQMIAIGGTIGTGVFVGVGGTLHKGGPLGLLLGYSVMGGLVYAMMVALGEMTACRSRLTPESSRAC